MEFVEVIGEGDEGSLKVGGVFVNAVDVSAWWEFVVDESTEAIGGENASVLEGVGKEIKGCSGEVTSESKVLWAGVGADDGKTMLGRGNGKVVWEIFH